MAKVDLRANLKGKSNIKNFSNDKVSLDKAPKKNIIITTNKKYIDSYKIIAFDFYKKNNCISLFSWAHFLPIAMHNVKALYEKKYKKLLELDDQYLKFYQTKSKASNAGDFYDLVDYEKLTIILEKEDIDLYYQLMHTFYINERTNITAFSVSIYFIDFVKHLENDIIDLKMIKDL